MSSPTTTNTPTAHDRFRQWAVAIGAVIAIAGAAIGAGAFGGTAIEEAAEGALAADATLLAPASTAFAIWSFIYAGLAAFAVYQAFPSKAADPRLRATSWWVLASMFLNAIWIGVIHAGLIWVSVVLIAVLAAVLGRLATRLAASPPSTWTQRFTTDVPMGLYLGWVVVATIANVTAAISSTLDDFQPEDGAGFAVAALAAAAVLAVAIARGLRQAPVLSISTGIALAWGLWWIAVGRLTDLPHDVATGWAAGIAAIVALSTPFAMRDYSYIGRRDPLAPE